ncbi:MAG TPA: SIMPL domain-containing protein, partial [Dehalococcoidia bacterium]|nr:SIMPL domain-containing protein [Dehalococcoidia bacterium]
LSGVSASGEGKVTGKPDVAVLTVGVKATRPNVEDARSAAATAQTGVIGSLKTNGVADKDIQTVEFTVQPQYDYQKAGTPTITGYTVSNVVTARIHNLDSAGKAIDDAVNAGGNDAVVQNIDFTIDDPTDLKSQAREAAVKQAKAQAQQLADAAGEKLGKLISISEGTSSPIPLNRLALPSASGTADSAAQTPVQPGELEITVNVNVLYAIQ